MRSFGFRVWSLEFRFRMLKVNPHISNRQEEAVAFRMYCINSIGGSRWTGLVSGTQDAMLRTNNLGATFTRSQ